MKKMTPKAATRRDGERLLAGWAADGVKVGRIPGGVSVGTISPSGAGGVMSPSGGSGGVKPLAGGWGGVNGNGKVGAAKCLDQCINVLLMLWCNNLHFSTWNSC